MGKNFKIKQMKTSGLYSNAKTVILQLYISNIQNYVAHIQNTTEWCDT